MVHAKFSKTALYCGTALAMLARPAAAQPAPNARPTGGQVAAGQASIGGNSTLTLISQQSQNAVINWQSYNIGSAQTVQYQQPNAQGFTLNRVISAQPSQIAGHIMANGQIAIVNQSGVVFYRGATVDTAGLVVSASGITNQDFMAGRLVFSQAPNPGAKISNAGNITIAQAGLAAIVAPQVQNSGTISAQLGRVVLGGAASFALDMNGDGLVALNVTGEVTQVNLGGQKIAALVTNIGTILAPGGTVVLTAAAADGLVQKIISAGGSIAAPTVGNEAGRVLVSGIGGDVEIDGTVSATGTATGTRGGQIEVNSDHNVTVAAGATIDASGDSGGGLIAVGTTAAYAAAAPAGQATRTAANTAIAAGATIRASATRAGNGGRIAVAASGTASIAGAVVARGGPGDGNGGSVLIAGRDMVVSQAPDTSAPAGPRGAFIALVNGNTTICDEGCTDTYATFFSLASQGATFTVNNGSLTFEPSDNAHTSTTIDFATVDGGGRGGVAGDIFVDQGTDLVATGVTASAAGTFFVLGTLSAGVSGAMSLAAGLGLATPQGAVITEDNSDPGGPPQTPAIIADTLALRAENGDVQLEYGTNQIGTLASASASGTFNLGNGGALIVAGPLTATNVTLTTIAGDITDIGSISATAALGLIDLTAAGSIAIGGTLTAGTLSGGVFGGTMMLDAQAGAVTQSAGGLFGQLNAGTLTAQASGDVDLQGATGSAPVNRISVLSGGTAGGDFILTDAANLVVTGGVIAGTEGVAGDELLLLEVGSASAASSLTISPDLTLTSLGGTIGLQADHFSIDGTLNAGASGEVDYDIYQPNGTLALVFQGSDTFNGVTYTSSFDASGIGLIAAGTLVLGRVPGQTGRAGTLFLGAHLEGPTVGLYSTGAILEDTNPGIDTGVLLVSSLFGAAGGAVSLNNTANQIAVVAGLSSAGALVLDDAGPLSIAGNLAGASVELDAAGGVSENAGVTVAATSAAGTLAIESGNGGILLFGSNDAGTLNASTNTYSGTVLLSAGGGDITETQAEGGTSGVIGAGTLAASASGSISLANVANNIAAIAPGTLPDGTRLAGLVAGATLALVDDQSLALTDATVGGSAVTIDLTPDAAGALSQTGGAMTATSGAISLTAASILIGGTLEASGQSVFLDATAGDLRETAGGAIVTGALTALAPSGTVDLGSTAKAAPVNRVGTLLAGAAAGDFILTDAANLTVAGDVTAGGANLVLLSGTAGQARTLTLARGVTLTDLGGTIALTADDFALAGGTLNAGTGEADFANFLAGGTLTYGGSNSSFAGTSLGALTADTVAFTSNGDLVIADALSLAGGTLGLFARNAILEQGSGAVTASIMAGSAGGDITLDGANAIATIGPVTIRGTEVAGLASTGGAISLSDTGSLTIAAGAVVAGDTGVYLVTGSDLIETAGADIASAGAMLLDSATGSLKLGGTVSAGTLALDAAGDILASGTLQVGTLAGLAGGSMVLDTDANDIAAIDQVTISAPVLANSLTLFGLAADGPISLHDSGALAIGMASSGATVSSLGAGVTLIATGYITQTNGTLTAAGDALLQGASLSQSGAGISATGAVTIDASLAQSDSSVTAAGIVTITGATLGQSGNAVIAGAGGVTLTLTGGASQGAGGTIASTGGGVSLAAATLAAAGTIESAGMLAVATNGDMIFATGADLSGTSGVRLAASAGNIVQQAGATISSDPMAGGAPSGAGLVSIDTPGTLSLAGTLIAGTIELGAATAPAQLIWDNNVILTGSSLSAGADLTTPIAFGTQNGLFVQAGTLTQTGQTTIGALGGAAATVEISLAGTAGLVQFNAATGTASGLFAPQAQLLLELQSSGHATGNIDVAGLNVFYAGTAQPGQGGAALTGLVGGKGGPAAAGAGFSHPASDPAYLINGCEIGAPTCGEATPPPGSPQIALAVPVDDPVQDGQIQNGVAPAVVDPSEFVVQQIVLRRRDTSADNEDDDLILPNVADQDY